MLGLNTENSQAQWGGVVLLGRGKVTDCNYGAVTADPALHTCERDTEGSRRSGRSSAASTTPTMPAQLQFVQIRYSGFVIGADKELQSP